MNGIVSECECDSEDFVRERNSLIILLLYTCGLRLAELAASTATISPRTSRRCASGARETRSG